MKNPIFFLMLVFIGTIFVSCERSDDLPDVSNLPMSMRDFVGNGGSFEANIGLGTPSGGAYSSDFGEMTITVNGNNLHISAVDNNNSSERIAEINLVVYDSIIMLLYIHYQ
jgi:hypothetical protein